ncbi:ABC transporter ATP-binding protein [Capnocytophaga catalasegens]|uniref:ABC transporter n=1 Tax=Capnocytophaga catalasegens TaxID=1004260 RepID=A0AAV5AXU0_9FLAO|nr:ABC transporter ATP-binding protein [Capnocytophaga catalasegens]GIZ16611.1 ABC transporter [Capnocytophaga catalasegens]GJM51414.1 ABC transporter [Capnocytophaga catalasegens]GJM52875.1 ABC transporter [Capnocytophaga catalasegens]
MKHLKYVNKYFFKYKRKLFYGIIITIIARIFALVMPEYVQYSMDAIEQHIANSNSSVSIERQLLIYILIIIGSAILSGFFTFLMRQLIINVSRYIEFDMKNEIYQKYQTLSQHFYKQNRIGDLMNRISEDVGKVRMYAGPAIMYSVQTITLFVCIIPLMIYTSPTLTLYTLLPLPFLAGFIYYLSKKINQKTTIVQAYLSDLSTFSQEMFSGINVIKSYAIEKEIAHELEQLSQEGKDKNLSLAKVQAWFLPAMIFLIGLSIIFVMFVGGHLYIKEGTISVGVITKFSIYVLMLTWPVTSIGWVSSIVQQAEASQKRINEFLNEKPDIQNNTTESTPIQGEIVFENVTFTYPDTQITALSDISFRIPQGKSVAIIGKTGSGKTTILELITRMYDVTQGRILIDGKDIKTLNLNDLRSSIASVPQESFLFSDTIKNNICFGNEQASDEQIIEVASLAEVHQNITNFADGYDSILGERGVSISGGQRQRICIARALLKKAAIYLFDDCLSAVDTDTEEKILHNLSKTAQNKTRIIVSHRISATRNADFILMIDNGQIIGQGSHQELYSQSSVYKNYYDLQTAEN